MIVGIHDLKTENTIPRKATFAGTEIANARIAPDKPARREPVIAVDSCSHVIAEYMQITEIILTGTAQSADRENVVFSSALQLVQR